MVRDDFRPPLLKKMSFLTLEGTVCKIYLNSNSTKCPSAFYIFKKKLSELDFWNSSYDHFSDSISKLPLVAKM